MDASRDGQSQPRPSRQPLMKTENGSPPRPRRAAIAKQQSEFEPLFRWQQTLSAGPRRKTTEREPRPADGGCLSTPRVTYLQPLSTLIQSQSGVCWESCDAGPLHPSGHRRICGTNEQPAAVARRQQRWPCSACRRACNRGPGWLCVAAERFTRVYYRLGGVGVCVCARVHARPDRWEGRPTDPTRPGQAGPVLQRPERRVETTGVASESRLDGCHDAHPRPQRKRAPSKESAIENRRKTPICRPVKEGP
ncbi:hypothetical protein QBC39DRAFT_355712 [Podospora conica]|nr:hypothetical protein QBC39DRAFT_355712 [Schizothecium conicum]